MLQFVHMAKAENKKQKKRNLNQIHNKYLNNRHKQQHANNRATAIGNRNSYTSLYTILLN